MTNDHLKRELFGTLPFTALFWLGVAGLIGYFLITGDHSPVELSLGWLIFGACSLASLVLLSFIVSDIRDLIDGPDCTVGKITEIEIIWLGDEEFSVPRNIYGWVKEGQDVAVYYLPRSRVVVRVAECEGTHP